ncbi:MAG TPA: dihydropteroate synthase [Gemmatimonadaceae bacterium]|nr:dihydropteroate synthase [Gemmatimonadaceae bacterium]
MHQSPSSNSDFQHPPLWQARGRGVHITRPLVIAILNVTPDSFSDGGRHQTIDAAVEGARQMIAEGADGIDVGGESTRPQGAKTVSTAEELRRVIPVVRALREGFPGALLSIDTTKSEVAEAALGEGADIVNDVSGFRIDPRMGEIAAAARAGVILMHSRGSVSEMGTYQHATYGDDVVGEIVAEVQASVASALAAGVSSESIVIDPGIGFAKRSEHSLRVLAELPRFVTLGLPILVGVSRKRFVGELSGVNRAEDRVAGTVGANVAALMRGARLFRVHDVAPNREALDVAWGILQAGDATAVDSRFPIHDSR